MTIDRTQGGENRLATEISFGPFSLNRSLRQRHCAGKAIRLGEPSYKVLDALAARAGETIDNLTLMRAVWGSLNIEDSSLRAAVVARRRALAAAGCKREYITTVPRRGYRFSEPVIAKSVAQRRPRLMLRNRVIGRESFISAVLDDLREYRLVSIVGPGGVGKTAVAQCIAEEAIAYGCVDDAGMVALCSSGSSDDLLQVLQRDLGVPTTGEDRWLDIEAFLDSRRVLVILDGCDRLVANVAPSILSLIGLTSGAGHLTTYFAPLGVVPLLL
jgi:DNA-binding winged helix-turn-helix (wHTH) protein